MHLSIESRLTLLQALSEMIQNIKKQDKNIVLSENQKESRNKLLNLYQKLEDSLPENMGKRHINPWW